MYATPFYGRYETVVKPSIQPITIDDVKPWLAMMPGTADPMIDPMLSLIIEAVVQMVENIGNKYIMSQTVRCYFKGLNNWSYYFDAPSQQDNTVTLYKGNIQQIISINYMNEGNLNLLPHQNYFFEKGICKSSIKSINDAFFTNYDTLVNGVSKADVVQIDVIAGYGANPTDVPAWLRKILIDLVCFYYNNRADCECSDAADMPMQVANQLSSQFSCFYL